MLNRLLYEFYKSPNNGKQIILPPDGRRMLLTHSEIMGPARLNILRARNKTPRTLAEFDELGQVVGPESIVPEAGPWGFGGSMIVVGDALHLAWTGPHGIMVSRSKMDPNNLRWDRARTVFEGDAWLGDMFAVGGRVGLTYHQTHDRQTESVGVMWLDGRGKTQELTRGRPMFAPVVDVDQGDQIHLVWSDVAEQLYYTQLTKPGADIKVERLGPGRQPTILVNNDHVLIVVEDEFGHLRYYALHRSNGSSRRNVPLTAISPWLTSDQIHSPGLTRDRHGVAWLFFANNTRRSTFWTRWMGDAWGELTNGPRIYFRPPHFDFNLLQIGRMCVEKSVAGVERSEPPAKPNLGAPQPPVARDVGLLLTCEPPVKNIEYRREVVPDLVAESGGKILFLDMLEAARTENIELHVETANKHPDNPLMQLGPAGSFDEDRVFNHGCVIFDDGKYRMWYGGIREHRPGEPYTPWYDWIKCGYAESDDGIHWKRVGVGLVEWKGSKENNIIPFLRHAPMMFKDEKDPDPKRRYKGFYFWNSGEHMDIARTGKYEKKYDPREEKFLMELFTSADGLHLERHSGEVAFPGNQVKPLSSIPQCVFRDDDEPDPAKRYKAYGFMSLNLRRRGTSYLYSPDCLNWTAHPEMPVIDPAIRGTPPAVGGPTGQVHDTICFPYEGYYVALYQDQHDPLNMPVELAVSRNATSFRHVKPGSQVIPVGPPDSWDALTILPTMPVFLEREIRLYYGGGTERALPGGKRNRWVTKPGLATLRRDGFTSLRLVAGKRTGSLLTIPFQLPKRPSRLRVNAQCKNASHFRVGLIDATTGRPLPGYALTDCNPFTGDQLDATVTWKSKRLLPQLSDLPITQGQVRLHWRFDGNHESIKLHAFWFEHS